MNGLPLDQVRTLLTAVDEGTFDAAAAVLHVTPSAVSQRIKALEQRVGRVLLVRTKPLRLTGSGQAVARFARQLAWLEGETLSELGVTGATGMTRVSIAVNADSIATWFLPALTKVAGVPQVCFELLREDQDHTAALLREGLVMAAVTSSPDPVTGCLVRRLGNLRYVPVASPAFAAKWLAPWPAVPLREVLGGAPVVVWDRRDDLQDRFARELTGRGAASALRHYVPTAEGFVETVAAGMGWGMVPQSMARPLLAAGRLLDLAPRRPVDVPLHWQQWKLDSPTLTAVADAVVAEASVALGAAEVSPGN
jgi:LysR family transcriptional regulator, chromosome initiation inhibitor